jgi:hypothetical protein
MNPRWGQFFVAQRGQFRMAFDTGWVRITGGRMPGAAFETNPFYLHGLPKDCSSGVLQLPDFQRSWVWDEDASRASSRRSLGPFPLGALMTLEMSGSDVVTFGSRSTQRAAGAVPRPASLAPSAAVTQRRRRIHDQLGADKGVIHDSAGGATRD